MEATQFFEEKHNLLRFDLAENPHRFLPYHVLS